MTIVRLAVWDEIQEALRYVEAKQEFLDRYDVVNGAGITVSTLYAAYQGRPARCALCGHEHDVHSKILTFEPCLDCDCIGWTVLTRPDPGRRERR